MTHRCRLCTVNDRDALRDQLAAAMFEGRMGDVKFEDCGLYWQTAFRQLADDVLDRLQAK